MVKKYYVIEKVVNPFTSALFMTVYDKEDFCIVESEEVAKDYCKKHFPQFSYREEELDGNGE